MALCEASDVEDAFAAQDSSGSESEDDGGSLLLGNVTVERREQQPEAPATMGGVGGGVLQVGRPPVPASLCLLPCRRRRRCLPACRRRRLLTAALRLPCRSQLPTFQFASKRKQRQDPGRPLLLFDINGVLMQHTWNGTAHVVRAAPACSAAAWLAAPQLTALAMPSAQGRCCCVRLWQAAALAAAASTNPASYPPAPPAR